MEETRHVTTHAVLYTTQGGSACPQSPPLHFWPTAEADVADFAEADLSLVLKKRALGRRPSGGHAAGV